jgi:hypothetical protein
MKAPFVSVVCLVAISLTGVALASPGPTSPLYLTYNVNLNGGYNIDVVQGNTITSFPEVYGAPYEIPIAVSGDVRTTSYSPGSAGGQYSLAGVPTGTSYVLPSVVSGTAYDSTTDGSHNYLVDYFNGGVYQTARDFTNPTLLFSTGAGLLGITYDGANHSLWIVPFEGSTLTDYSLSGQVLSSFNISDQISGGLAWNPQDGTLWMVSGITGDLVQYSTAGAFLSTGPNVGYTLGGEFNEGTVPEPGTLVMFGSGILGLAGVVRRKINL